MLLSRRKLEKKPTTATFLSYLEALEDDPEFKLTQSLSLKSTNIYLGYINSKNCQNISEIDTERLIQENQMNNVHLNYITHNKKQTGAELR